MSNHPPSKPQVINIIVASLLLAILLLFIYIIVNKKQYIVPDTEKEKQLRDSLATAQVNINASANRQLSLQRSYDSLLVSDRGVIYRSHERTKFIFNTASPDQLDSIIRSAWYHKGY